MLAVQTLANAIAAGNGTAAAAATKEDVSLSGIVQRLVPAIPPDVAGVHQTEGAPPSSEEEEEEEKLTVRLRKGKEGRTSRSEITMRPDADENTDET